MRVAPLAFLLNPSLEDDRVVIRDFCRVTHHSDEAYAAALAVIAAVRAAAAGTWALRSGLIRARTRARAGDPRFIGAFSSASQEHFHYCDGKPV
jgi:ADP-ribosylglycohydrolase